MRNKHCNTHRGARHVPGQKPRGCFQERVKQVGPEHFAIVPVDCGKPEARSRVADFYGNVLCEPFSFDISRSGLRLACLRIQETFRQHGIQDCVCAVETTGRYHRPIKAVFQEQHWDTREVHPFTTSLIRRSADLGTKTDDIDLAAIHRAAVDGLAMRPEVLGERAAQWRLLTRHRRDWVEKAATLKVQLKETLHAYLPGYTALWRAENFWESPVAATIATTFDSAQAMQQASREQFRQAAREAGSVVPQPTIDRILAWTHQAAPADQAAAIYFRRARSLWDDLQRKRAEICQFELELAGFLCQSPCVLLLAFPGINVVSASDYGAELGPITNYATSKSITGRAGWYPSRYQTAHTDRPDGPLVVRRNRELRAAMMRVARNLGRCHHVFMALADDYRRRDDVHDAKVVIARAFSRLSYYLIAGERLFPHKALLNRESILQKVMEFYRTHHGTAEQTTGAMRQVIAWLSPRSLQAERTVFAQQYHDTLRSKRQTAGTRRLSEILPQLLLHIDQRLQTLPEDQDTHTTSNTEDRTHGL